MTTKKHPCFDKSSVGECGRVHLPVAPKCNIKCNYCDRKHDCVNESRPGVTSAVLKPHQALEYLHKVMAAAPSTTVVGIAGPGDPMANPAQTLETMRLVKKHYPDMLFCLSSNGLGMPPYLDKLKELGVTHATITMNAVDPDIAERIYAWARDGKVIYRKKDAAKILIERQLESIKGLVERGITVKVNTIVIPGYNDHHVEAVAKVVGELGATLQNCIPVYPNKDTPFADVREPDHAMIKELRKGAGQHVEQMTHCKRCRADAVGLLEKDRSGEFADTLDMCSRLLPSCEDEDRPNVAVASREGMLVNMHLGEARSFQIWGPAPDGGFHKIEDRPAPPMGGGPKRWESLASTLKDCRAVLAAAMGDTPKQLLEENGLPAHAVTGFVTDNLAALYRTGDLSAFAARRGGGCGTGCSGGGGGCG
ncbi:nitrogenase cofactor biosynthesis protein NifB [Salidesulfovibrio brasiliensis]|uniref:nitrogenase cofactor biosynthesis protein NifB n=1 Tax=Salidesulfovibrio brasiliensis TaxID=221711 RepID=UPI0009F9A0B4|nr:nitrogenase cofactor biosynthesis protein NifB [Salidesulfovibrio brasiliensis]